MKNPYWEKSTTYYSKFVSNSFEVHYHTSSSYLPIRSFSSAGVFNEQSSAIHLIIIYRVVIFMLSSIMILSEGETDEKCEIMRGIERERELEREREKQREIDRDRDRGRERKRENPPHSHFHSICCSLSLSQLYETSY